MALSNPNTYSILAGAAMALNRFAKGDDSSDEDFDGEYAQGPRRLRQNKKATVIPKGGKDLLKKATDTPKGGEGDDYSDEVDAGEYAQCPQRRGQNKEASAAIKGGGVSKKATVIPKGPGSKGGHSRTSNVDTNSESNNASSKYFTCRGTLNSDALEVFKELSCPQLMEASPRPPKPIEVIIGDVIDPATFCMVQKCELDSIKPMENVLTLEGNFRTAYVCVMEIQRSTFKFIPF